MNVLSDQPFGYKSYVWTFVHCILDMIGEFTRVMKYVHVP